MRLAAPPVWRVFKMVVFHKDPMGITVSFCVYILLFYGDWALVYHVIEYGKHENASERRTYGVLFAHFLLLMAIISHIRAALSNPGYVPLPSTKIDFSSDLEKADPNQKRKKKREHTGMFEWSVCTKCETYRPPRSHHCRKCGRCVRRMDHHCPWINNCVGELNFKYFFLFLVYTGLLCLYAIILIVSDWVHHWSEDDENDSVDRVCTLILFFETVIFGMFVTAVACGSSIAVLCDRNAIELRRYGAPAWFPKTPKLILVQALCGRGSMFFWVLPCVRPRIPDPVPPSKLPSFNSVQNV